MTPRPLARLLPLALAALLPACGGGQSRGSPFDPGWVDDQGAAMAAFERAFRAARIPLGADVAVGVVGKRALVGLPLAGGAPWVFEHALHGRPAVAGGVVVGAGAGEVFALDARTGKHLWSRPTGGRIRGVGDDGKTTIVSLIPITGVGSLVLAVGRDGSVVRQIEDDNAIGVPAVIGDVAFLPWRGHALSIYDLPTGEERARLTLEPRVSRVFTLDGALFCGERAATRFDDRIGLGGGRGATTVSLPAPLGGLAGDPAWMRPGTDWVEREADALDRVRLYARPTTTGRAGVDGGRFAATYYRIALGLDARTGALGWAHAHAADVLGGAAYAGGFALCDAKGGLTFLDSETGAVTGQLSLGRPVDACLVQADVFTRPATVTATPLAEQLAEVVRLPGAELAEVQKVLRRELVRLDPKRSP